MASAEQVSKLIESLQKEYGLGSAFKLTDSPISDVTGWTDTGCGAINDIIGQPGIPDGRVTTILGPPSVGKTTLVAALITSFQERGGIPFLLPAEPFDRDRAIVLGVDPDNLVILDAGTVEHNFSMINHICEHAPGGDTPTLVLWDSFSASPTKAELDAEPGFEGKAMGEHSRLVSQQMRKLQSKMEAGNIAFVVVLQSKSKIGISYGSQTTYLAEKPWHFYSYVQLELKRIGNVKRGDAEIGIKTKFTCKKNKCGSPFRSAEVELLFEDGFDSTGGILEKAIRNGIVVLGKGKGRFVLKYEDGTEVKFTRRKWPTILRENPPLEQHIRSL